MKNKVEDILGEICPKYMLTYTFEYFDYFPTVVNDDFCNQMVIETAKSLKYDIIHKSIPYRFGEDFGWFSKKYKGAMFGIGAGVHFPALHQADYDFPDEIIETGMNMFKGIVERILKD